MFLKIAFPPPIRVRFGPDVTLSDGNRPPWEDIRVESDVNPTDSDVHGFDPLGI